ncbi:MAG: Mur ligase family protein [Candidatus Nanoperiomorbaceae bacterium]
MFKWHVRRKLERYVRKYFRKYQPQLILVVGAVGKTTTKTAIATVLSQKFRVGMEPENHNSELSVPLAVLGVKYPPAELVHKLSTWRKVFKAMKSRVEMGQGVDVIVQELGTDHPGDLLKFAKYLRANIAVVTSVSAEHLENFPDGLAGVAREELSVQNFTKALIVNHDDVAPNYADLINTANDTVTDYGLNGGEYRFQVDDGSPLTGYDVHFFAPEFGGASAERPDFTNSEAQVPKMSVHLVGEHNVRAAVAAAAVGAKLGMTASEIASGVAKIRPVPGRMNILRGRNDSILLDDTYNSSSSAALAALDTLCQIGGKYTQRIAILGSMNELGSFSKAEHETVGAACDPEWLDVVITIGDDAKNYLGLAAAKNGCTVKSFASAIEAGEYASRIIRSDQDSAPVILIKGSQNNVFAEEATKILLADQADASQLVRQSPDWMARKNAYFEKITKIAPDDV